MYQSITLQAGIAVEMTEAADFFRLLDATQADLNVIFYNQGREVSRAESIGAGYAERFVNGAFDRIRLQSAAGGVFAFVLRLGNEVRYDKPPTGAVTLTGQQGAFTQSGATVTNTNAVIKAANVNRRYLLIQNNDSSADVFVNVAGAAATTANGIKIVAGGALELINYCPTAAINAIGSTPSNANVIVVEG